MESIQIIKSLVILLEDVNVSSYPLG